MRGLFTYSAAHRGQGPQLSQATTAGDQLTLQRRVYNYSFIPMPDNTTAYLPFYAQRSMGTISQTAQFLHRRGIR
ncbi:MAG: hypothetical protein ACJ74Y_03015 [Bryobacteraceae bacterium]